MTNKPAVCQVERTPPDPDGALGRAKAETIKRGGTWEGGLGGGSYVMQTPFGVIEGSYTVSHNTVRFIVQRKPALVPCALIWAIVDQFLSP